MFNISVNFKDKYKKDHNFGNLKRRKTPPPKKKKIRRRNLKFIFPETGFHFKGKTGFKAKHWFYFHKNFFN